MPKEIPPVPAQYLIAANMTAYEDSETMDERGVVDAVSSALEGISENELEHVIHRLIALGNTLDAGEGIGPGWQEIEGSMFVEEPLIRAAARARLIEADSLEDLQFDPEELANIALDETTPQGSA
jgi:hypothetical protein